MFSTIKHTCYPPPTYNIKLIILHSEVNRNSLIEDKSCYNLSTRPNGQKHQSKTLTSLKKKKPHHNKSTKKKTNTKAASQP